MELDENNPCSSTRVVFSSQQETEIIVFCEVFHAVHD
jgi:hypothetical protein